MQFSHLHVHTQYSLLDGAASIEKLYNKAAEDNMPALAITDHGNMFGVFNFVAEAHKHKTDSGNLKVKPIVGCEFYLVEDRHKKQFTKENKDKRYHQLLLAKNAEGYKNISKLCSLGWIEGLYSKYPRIDKELLLKYNKGLIATTCCIGAEVPQTILRESEEKAEERFKWWLDLFGDDYYVEIQRHGMPEQQKVNDILLKLAKKYNVKVIASNDSHYVDQKDANAHDILLCINTNAKQSVPSIKEFADDDINVKGKRFAFYNDEFYFKKTNEMAQTFSDLPEAIDNTNAVVDKIDVLDLKRDILLPNFPIPKNFKNQDDYLEHLAKVGAKKRYTDVTEEIEQRLNFELHTIKTMGFAGYFLIVSDFISAGRDLGVYVGPGRGSAAGSVVAYCLGITNIDPIKYELLFERFLNPERNSLPDIDTDFDDDGRQKVIDYVVKKYGQKQVAQIITHGSMAAKTSIRDVARVLDLPLAESDFLAKLVPERPGINLSRLINAPIDGDDSLKNKENLRNDDLEKVNQLRKFYKKNNTLQSEVLKEAMVLEGSVRNMGVHAAGVIIAPSDLTEIIPLAVAKDSDLAVTQYEGSIIEDVGVIKMDFLGLKTLSIIKDAIAMIAQTKNKNIDIENIPLNDPKTLELYQRGDTTGTFQFESEGMQTNLRQLKPDRFEDLIAMNALYRPGPMEYIPNYIKRKHGLEEITFDLPEMKEYLGETFGITVYQEQVMLLSQKLAGFTKGQADTLRKAMGKKQKSVLDKMKSLFVEGCEKNGYKQVICNKIWADWEAFASYAFNKSHSTCYAYVAFQTAYLKAHFPAEYMASLLSRNANNIEKITFFMEECRKMQIPVLGPDVNESETAFSVNEKNEIRFGMAAIKGVGSKAVKGLIAERNKNGKYKDIFDFMQRINLREVNKRVMEGLIYAGCFDRLTEQQPRSVFFTRADAQQPLFLEKLLRWAANAQNNANSSQASLFGDYGTEVVAKLGFPEAVAWPRLETLKKERDVIGFYISGHPLDQFKFEIEQLASSQIQNIALDEEHAEMEFQLGVIVTSALHKTDKNGNPYGNFIVEDYNHNFRIMLFKENYLRFRHFFAVDNQLYISGKVQRRYGNQFEFKVNQVELLSEIAEKFTKSVVIEMPLASITDEWIDHLNDITEKHTGTKPIQLCINDNNKKLELNGGKHRIAINKEIADKILEKNNAATVQLK